MIGQQLGHYRIDGRIGAGAMGEVYRAYDTRLRRDVAIKRLHSERGELLDEARAAATLNHPNICTVYEVHESDAHRFIVMELVDGRPLTDQIHAGGLPIATVLDYGLQIADAVACAHDRGIVHRDLKPSNIAVTRDGRVKVLDFGLARRARTFTGGSGASATATQNEIAGTPQYMSPEAVRGDSCTLQSDVWSLGILLFEMATGRLPYEAPTAVEVMARVLSDAAIEVPPDVPRSLAAVIRRCLAKQPERRYRQAGEIRAALQGIADTLSTQRFAIARSPQRLRTTAALGALFATIAAIAVGVRPLGDALDRLVSEPAIAFAERDWLVISDFANDTSEPVFDRALNTALAAAIGQSRYVNIVPANRIRESMRRMQRDGTSAPDAQTAREIALREGFPLVLAPTITSSGNAYLLTAALIEPSEGVTVRSEVVHAAARGDVLAALDELAVRVRRALGEASTAIGAQSRPLAKVTTASLEALQRFSRAREAHMAQQLDTARRLYEEALSLDTTFTAARASLGIINYEFFDRAKGVELLEQSLKAVDGLTDGERLSVQTFHAMAVARDLEQAVTHYKAFLAVHPDVATAHNNLGRVYLQMRRFPEAIAAFNDALRLDPDLFLTYASLGQIYLYELGDADAALATAQRQLARSDRAARAYGIAGAAHAAKGALRQAETALRRALDLDPETRFAFDYYYLGHVLRLQGRLAEAREVFLKLLSRAPQEISAQYEAGAVSQLLGDRAAAQRHLQATVNASLQHLKQQPADVSRRLELAAAYARLGDPRRARAAAGNTLENQTASPAERAGVYVLLGDTTRAIQVLSDAVAAGYRDVVTARLYSDLHALQGDLRYEELLARMGGVRAPR